MIETLGDEYEYRGMLATEWDRMRPNSLEWPDVPSLSRSGVERLNSRGTNERRRHVEAAIPGPAGCKPHPYRRGVRTDPTLESRGTMPHESVFRIDTDTGHPFQRSPRLLVTAGPYPMSLCSRYSIMRGSNLTVTPSAP